MNRYIIQLGDLAWPKVLVIGLLIVAVYYFGLYDDGSYLETQLQQANSTLNESKKKLDQTKKALADADRFEAEVKAALEQFNKITEFMPENMSQSELMSIVSKQSSLSGAKVMRIEPMAAVKDVTKNENFDSVRVKLALQGTFTQLVAFLSNISRVPNLLTFDQVDMGLETNPGAENANLNFEGVLVGYKYSKSSKPLVSGQPLPANGAPNAK